jgi:preprotein translocase subunit YajC
MKAILGLLIGLLFCLLATVLQVAADSPLEAPPAQNPDAARGASPVQTPGRGGERRPGLFGKLTAVHDQSVEITQPSGDMVTVKISGSTQFRKEGQDAKLSDLKVGDIVFVRGAENPDHTWTAEIIGTRSNGGFGGDAGAGAGGGRGGPGGGGSGSGSGGGRPAGVLGQDYVFGEVKTVDAPKLMILRPDNVTQTVELNEETSLRKGRDSITMADIQPGDHIMVRGGMANNVFQPKSVMVIGPEQWKRMQDMGMASGPPASNPPNENNQPQKPPEPPH